MAQIQHTFVRNFRQIEKLRHLNAFITETVSNTAREQLLKSVQRHNQGARKGPLDGITFAIKDNICTHDVRTTCGSKFLKDYMSPFAATAVDRLLDQGCIMVGKTNMDEFGMGGASLNSYFGPVYNHLSNADKGEWLVSGGSSGGSAVTVASDMCTFSLGSDTGGSVRVPASFCGTLGLKPTYGRVSRFGLVPYASSLDTIGIFSKDLAVLAQAFDAISGWDPRDATSSHDSHVTCADKVSTFESSTRVALLKDFDRPLKCPEYAPAVEASVRWLESEGGASVEVVALPELFKCVTAYYMLCAAEASSNMAKYSGMVYGPRSSLPSATAHDAMTHTQLEGLGEVVRRRISTGKYFLSKEGRTQYEKALEVQTNMFAQFQDVFQRFDLIVMPTTIGPAPSIAYYKSLDSLESDAYDTFVCPVNMCGLPAISVPFGETKESKLPLGVQLVANHFQEHKLLQAARLLLQHKSN